jgi:ADP-ribose pyrophosphatase
MREVIPKGAALIPEHAERVFKGIIYDVYQWQQELFDGSHSTFEMLKRPDTIEVIAIKDGKIVVLEEEQPGRLPFFGFPGGRHDVEAESELDAARRELLEETGMAFRTWKLLDVTQHMPKIDHFVYIFLATDLEDQVVPHLDSGEKIDVQLWDFAKVKASIADPRVRSFPKEVLDGVDSVQALFDIREYKND